VNGLCVRAAGAKEIVRPRRLIGRFWAALNFTVRQHRSAAGSGGMRDAST
jgi:hypothetical protein